MNVLSIRSKLLTSVAAGILLASFSFNADASRNLKPSAEDTPSKRRSVRLSRQSSIKSLDADTTALGESAIRNNLSENHYAFKSILQFVTTANDVLDEDEKWTTEAKTISSKRHTAVAFPKGRALEESTLSKALDRTIAPYIRFIIEKDTNAFQSTLSALKDLKEEETTVKSRTYDGNPYELLSVEADSVSYSVFNEDLLPLNKYAYTPFTVQADDLFFDYLISTIEKEQANASRPKASSASSNDVNTDEQSVTGSKKKRVAKRKSSKSLLTLAPSSDTPNDTEELATSSKPSRFKRGSIASAETTPLKAKTPVKSSSISKMPSVEEVLQTLPTGEMSASIVDSSDVMKDSSSSSALPKPVLDADTSELQHDTEKGAASSVHEDYEDDLLNDIDRTLQQPTRPSETRTLDAHSASPTSGIATHHTVDLDEEEARLNSAIDALLDRKYPGLKAFLNQDLKDFGVYLNQKNRQQVFMADAFKDKFDADDFFAHALNAIESFKKDASQTTLIEGDYAFGLGEHGEVVVHLSDRDVPVAQYYEELENNRVNYAAKKLKRSKEKIARLKDDSAQKILVEQYKRLCDQSEENRILMMKAAQMGTGTLFDNVGVLLKQELTSK